MTFFAKQNLLPKAKEHIDEGTEESLLYASLLLRMAMESEVYQTLKLWQKEMHPDDYKKWQPDKIIKLLTEYEPYINSDATFRVAREDEMGTPIAPFMHLFDYKALPTKFIKDSYHKLGKYLHSQHPDEIKKIDISKRKKTLCEIWEKLDDIVKNGTGRSNLGIKITFTCQECKKSAKVSENKLKNDKFFRCLNPKCNAEYDYYYENDNPTFKLKQFDFDCPHCQQKTYFSIQVLSEGNIIRCIGCKQKYELKQLWHAIPIDQEELE